MTLVKKNPDAQVTQFDDEYSQLEHFELQFSQLLVEFEPYIPTGQYFTHIFVNEFKYVELVMHEVQ